MYLLPLYLGANLYNRTAGTATRPCGRRLPAWPGSSWRRSTSLRAFVEEQGIECDWRKLTGVHALMSDDLYELAAAAVDWLREAAPCAGRSGGARGAVARCLRCARPTATGRARRPSTACASPRPGRRGANARGVAVAVQAGVRRAGEPRGRARGRLVQPADQHARHEPQAALAWQQVALDGQHAAAAPHRRAPGATGHQRLHVAAAAVVRRPDRAGAWPGGRAAAADGPAGHPALQLRFRWVRASPGRPQRVPGAAAAAGRRARAGRRPARWPATRAWASGATTRSRRSWARICARELSESMRLGHDRGPTPTPAPGRRPAPVLRVDRRHGLLARHRPLGGPRARICRRRPRRPVCLRRLLGPRHACRSPVCQSSRRHYARR